MIRATLLALGSPAEDLLIASGEWQVTLVGNIFRAIWVIAASLTGYHLFGFLGFVYGAALSGLPPFIYYLWFQRRKGMLIYRYEIYKIAFALGVAMLSYLAAAPLLALWSAVRRLV
jgi:hypothetical protein